VIVVDASAILAIVFQEEDGEYFENALAVARGGLMSAVNYWECLVGAHAKYGDAGDRIVDLIMQRMNIIIAPADPENAKSAAEAFARYKGRAGGRLNLGDTFAYALAMREGDGLLFKGNHFPRTDVKSVLPGDD
jgi:ribonuclease VapC